MPSLIASDAQIVIVQEQIMDPLHKIVRLMMHLNIASALALLVWLAMAIQSANVCMGQPHFGHHPGSARPGGGR